MKRALSIIGIIFILILPFSLRWFLHSKNILYVYMWSDYIKKDLVQQFEQKHNCRVIIDTYDSNEAMFTKLRLGGAGYDLVFPSNYFLDLMEKEKMLRTIDEKLIPNLSNVDWHLVKKFELPTTQFGIPYMVSFSGIAWRRDKLKKNPSSWDIFESRRLRGRATMLNDPRETIGAALRYLGFSANTSSADEIEKAKILLLVWTTNLAKLESEQYKNGIASAEYLVCHAYNGDTMQLAVDNPNIDFAFPKEGSLVSFDFVAILRDAPNPILAHTFINFLHDPKIAAQNMEFTKFRCVNLPARKLLPENLRFSEILYPESNPNLSFECIRYKGKARKLYLKAWDEIKSSK